MVPPSRRSAGSAISPVPAGPRRQAAAGVQVLGDRDLLLPGGQVGARRVLRRRPHSARSDVELQAAVVAVAGVDGPVVGRLAVRDRVPVDARWSRTTPAPRSAVRAPARRRRRCRGLAAGAGAACARSPPALGRPGADGGSGARVPTATIVGIASVTVRRETSSRRAVLAVGHRHPVGDLDPTRPALLDHLGGPGRHRGVLASLVGRLRRRSRRRCCPRSSIRVTAICRPSVTGVCAAGLTRVVGAERDAALRPARRPRSRPRPPGDRRVGADGQRDGRQGDDGDRLALGHRGVGRRRDPVVRPERDALLGEQLADRLGGRGVPRGPARRGRSR